jgi:hypothetical protein
MRTKVGVALASITLLSSCLRSTDEIPGTAEGVSITGTVIARDLTSGDFVRVASARASAIGTSRRAVSNTEGFFNLQRLPLGRLTVTIERTARDGLPRMARRLEPIDLRSTIATRSRSARSSSSAPAVCSATCFCKNETACARQEAAR